MSREDAWLDFAQMVAGWMLRGHGLWSVERRADGALIGFVPLGFEPGDREPELGFLFLAEAEGQGYAREAAEAARDFAFGASSAGAPLVSYVAPENLRSIRLAERLGARREPALDRRRPWSFATPPRRRAHEPRGHPSRRRPAARAPRVDRPARRDPGLHARRAVQAHPGASARSRRRTACPRPTPRARPRRSPGWSGSPPRPTSTPSSPRNS